jgi:hypothetical protein
MAIFSGSKLKPLATRVTFCKFFLWGFYKLMVHPLNQIEQFLKHNENMLIDC